MTVYLCYSEIDGEVEVEKVVSSQEKAVAWLHYLGSPDKLRVHSVRRRYTPDGRKLYFWESREVE